MRLQIIRNNSTGLINLVQIAEVHQGGIISVNKTIHTTSYDLKTVQTCRDNLLKHGLETILEDTADRKLARK